MSASKPLDLDDDDDDDVPPRRAGRPVRGAAPRPARPRPIQPILAAATIWALGKWASLGLGVLLGIAALSANAVQAGGLAGLACFAGIVARVLQAEEHNAP